MFYRRLQVSPGRGVASPPVKHRKVPLIQDTKPWVIPEQIRVSNNICLYHTDRCALEQKQIRII